MSKSNKAKVFLVFDEDGDLLRTRVITKDTSEFRGARYPLPWPEVSNESCFFNSGSNLKPEHQAEDYDLDFGFTSVLVATIDLD